MSNPDKKSLNKALDAMARIEAKAAPPKKKLGLFPLRLGDNDWIIQFACFVRDRDDFTRRFFLYIIEDVRTHEAPMVRLWPADFRVDLINGLQGPPFNWPLAFIDEVLAAAATQEAIFNARAKELCPPAPMVNPDFLPEEPAP